MSAVDADYLVFGFISAIESTLTSSIIIPEPIKKLCFEYYFICEHFVDHGRYMILNEAKDTISRKKGHDYTYNTVYGNQIIDPINDKIKKYKWTLKLLSYEDPNGFYFGIDSSDKKYIDASFAIGGNYPKREPFYAFTVTGYKRRHAKYQQYIDTLTFNVGDTICLTLNVMDKTFGIVINDDESNSDKHENVLIEDMKYRFAVTLEGEKHKAQLIKYETEK